MDNRCDFLKMASKAVPVGVAGAFLATGCKSASCDVEEVASINKHDLWLSEISI
ncbi:MAG: hypothetical protein NE330_11855 [Lentisphaeraceae bacterium]|nr:hypothetical protein [Lentisphaeraceae bacterium]